jgi:hypothetical protein
MKQRELETSREQHSRDTRGPLLNRPCKFKTRHARGCGKPRKRPSRTPEGNARTLSVFRQSPHLS